MRVMIEFALPVADSNEAVRTGKLHKVFQQLVEDLKPEASYSSSAAASVADFLSST